MLKIGKINSIQIETSIKKVNPIINNASSLFANEIKKYAKPYTPYRSGELEKSLTFIRKDSRVVGLVYNIKYASKMYFGGPNWNYNKSTNPQACPRWIERSWQIHKGAIFKNINESLKRVQ